MLSTTIKKRSKTFLKWIKKSRVILLGSSLIFIGLLINVLAIIHNNRTTNSEMLEIQTFFENEQPDKVVVDNQGNIIDVRKRTTTNYVAILEIPKINLKNGLVDKNSKANTVRRNIETMQPSDMPNVVNGNLILAAHSGTGRVAFFRNLHKLEKSDEIFIYYEGLKYTYRVFDIYDVEKTGKIQLKTYINKTILTLITCRIRTNNQIVIVSELISTE